MLLIKAVLPPLIIIIINLELVTLRNKLFTSFCQSCFGGASCPLSASLCFSDLPSC